MDEINERSVYPYEGKVAGNGLHTQSLSRAVTKLYGRHVDNFNGPFVLLDIRRTCKKLMGVAGLTKEIRDRIQGHAFSEVGAKYYDRCDYFKEKKVGLQRWALWLQKNILSWAIRLMKRHE